MSNRTKPSPSFNTVKHSNREKRIRRLKQERMILLAIFVLLAAILLTSLVLLICSIVDTVSSKNPTPNTGDNGTGTTPPVNSAGSISYTQVTQPNENLHIVGELLVVNKEHEYTTKAFESFTGKMVSISDHAKDKAGKPLCYCVDNSQKLQKSAFDAFKALAEAYAAVEGSPNLYVVASYRTYEDQKPLKIPEGFSDHHTGYLLQLKKYISASNPQKLDTDSWIYDNAYKYGFICRYPEGKEGETYVEDYTDAFRYVGTAHATYMERHNLCLEEYVEQIKNNYTDNQAHNNHLKITDDSGMNYEVYYVPAAAGDITTISVPSNYKYDISGDNIGGFIVTVYLDQPSA